MAIEATFTASRKAETSFELHIFCTSGLSKTTNRNEGRKIPTNKTKTSHHHSFPTCPFMPDMDSHLGAVRPRYQIGCHDKIKKMLFVHPFPFPDHFILHHGNMDRRAAEIDGPKFKKQFCTSVSFNMPSTLFFQVQNHRQTTIITRKMPPYTNGIR